MDKAKARRSALRQKRSLISAGQEPAKACRAMASLLQATACELAELRRPDQARMRDRNRVDWSLDPFLPEAEKRGEHGKIGEGIELLPDEFLQQMEVIGHPIKDFRRRQPVAAQLKLQAAHG